MLLGEVVDGMNPNPVNWFELSQKIQRWFVTKKEFSSTTVRTIGGNTDLPLQIFLMASVQHMLEISAQRYVYECSIDPFLVFIGEK